jgi:hypothetical protein
LKDIREIYRQFVSAYESKLAWISAEEKDAETRNARMLIDLLRLSRAATSLCAERQLAATNELVATYEFFLKQYKQVDAESRASAEELKSLKDQSPRELLSFMVYAARARANGSLTQFQLLDLQQSMIELGVGLLLTCLLLIFTEGDNLALETFLDELRSGLRDSVLSALIPCSDIVWTIVDATKAARTSRKKRSTDAADYIAMIEHYNNACYVWADGMDQYVKGIQEFRMGADE